jgi:hypothetical protein
MRCPIRRWNSTSILQAAFHTPRLLQENWTRCGKVFIIVRIRIFNILGPNWPIIVGTSAISAEEALKLLEPTVHLPHNNSTYAVSLSIFHQPHCVNHLRKALYPVKYPGLWEYNPDGTVERDTIISLHWGTIFPSFLYAYTNHFVRSLYRHPMSDSNVPYGHYSDAIILSSSGW